MQRRAAIADNPPGARSGSSASKVAALDLGSKTFKAVLGEVQDGRIVTRMLDKRLVGLGRAVASNDGMIGKETLAVARTAMAELKSVCEREGGAEILVVATRAIRSARNGSVILDAARELGLTAEVASGEREAELAYLAVTGGEVGKLVCELGSHSMQLAWRHSGPVESISIPAGYERVYPEFFRDAANFAQARGAYAAFLDDEVQHLATGCGEFIGMAMNTMARFVTGMEKAQVTDRHLSHARVREQVQALTSLSESEFGTFKSTTHNADKILSGLILFDHMLERTSQERGFIAEPELPVGLIVEHFESAAGQSS